MSLVDCESERDDPSPATCEEIVESVLRYEIDLAKIGDELAFLESQVPSIARDICDRLRSVRLG
jgi:hypothetical protein